ncbi:MAG: hypothetical protein ACE365_00460 [Gammaproteobacteria bacterium]
MIRFEKLRELSKTFFFLAVTIYVYLISVDMKNSLKDDNYSNYNLMRNCATFVGFMTTVMPSMKLLFSQRNRGINAWTSLNSIIYILTSQIFLGNRKLPDSMMYIHSQALLSVNYANKFYLNDTRQLDNSNRLFTLVLDSFVQGLLTSCAWISLVNFLYKCFSHKSLSEYSGGDAAVFVSSAGIAISNLIFIWYSKPRRNPQHQNILPEQTPDQLPEQADPPENVRENYLGVQPGFLN